MGLSFTKKETELSLRVHHGGSGAYSLQSIFHGRGCRFGEEGERLAEEARSHKV
jgi:hypothetical protein